MDDIIAFNLKFNAENGHPFGPKDRRKDSSHWSSGKVQRASRWPSGWTEIPPGLHLLQLRGTERPPHCGAS